MCSLDTITFLDVCNNLIMDHIYGPVVSRKEKDFQWLIDGRNQVVSRDRLKPVFMILSCIFNDSTEKTLIPSDPCTLHTIWKKSNISKPSTMTLPRRHWGGGTAVNNELLKSIFWNVREMAIKSRYLKNVCFVRYQKVTVEESNCE